MILYDSYVSGSLSVSSSATVGGTLTAQQLIVQTISSSVEYSSGSNVFGSSLTNTQTFTGSVGITGSLTMANGDIIPTAVQTQNLGNSSRVWNVWARSINSSGVPLDILTNNQNIRFQTGASYGMYMFATSQNINLQNGGTFNDNGYKLQINGSGSLSGSLFVSGSSVFSGSVTMVGTTASDTAPLGSELAAVTGTGTNWTLAGTNLNVGGYTHTVGSTTALTTSLAAVAGTYYQITYTITGRTAGSILIAYGGTSISVSTSGNYGPLASSTAVLTITPTTDFDGTVVLSIKSIGASSASSTFSNSSGGASIEVRASGIISNTFIGLNAGIKNTTGQNNTFISYQAGQSNTSGIQNTFIGQGAGQNNTVGSSNTFIGLNAGNINTTGVSNQFFGTNAGLNNTTGIENTAVGSAAGLNNTSGGGNIFFGRNAGRYISDGSTSATVIDNSVLLGVGSKVLASSQTNQIVIGTNSTGLGSNTTVLGNSATTTTAIYGNLLLGTTGSNGTDKLQVSGSSSFTGSVGITGSLTVNGPTTITSASFNYQENLAVTTGSFQTIVSAATGSYRSAFFDYVAYSASVVRAGTVISTWSGSVTEYYENYTNDLGGSTSVVSLQTAISGSNIQLQAGISGSAWSVRSLVRLL
jgi:hypothetical protein